ncbi:glutathione S-transferase family protein [Pseudemcibacter aquimaris]|uniref:glutathione S-transferase family protein n=1 Tax=Pseudemcibacter aquimaris TaxID=2857064 RepID=UPI002011D2DC|nr:glutathione S-transferase family protein [Pseudemcibacter aquimaris]MCC3861471.1 glutathione S-transferase family protein [Pseudemcibacter aquimaris]WDU58240.1 glutathione S-transferase family protein [Pseudemcibacter aquimaris]
MRHLYHYWFSPFSRKIRIAMLEKEMEFELELELPWKRRHEFLVLNPAGTVPILIEEDGSTICGNVALTEYLDEAYDQFPLLGKTPSEKAEVRRLTEWFDDKFNTEVTELVISEKVMKRYLKMGETEAAAIRFANQNIKHHLQYISYLTDRRNWLAGDDFSYADIAAAAHISCVDFFGDVPWDHYPEARDWYARIKSRPSMQKILKDNIAGFIPSKHYSNPDF